MSNKLWMKFMRLNKPGFPLKAGPFARWRIPYLKALYRKRTLVGPEPLRHRSVWSNW